MKRISTPALRAMTTALLAITAVFLQAQTPSKQWQQTFDGAAQQFDEIKFIRLDPQNNIVVTGRSNSSGTMLDVVTRKYAPDSTLLWSHTWNDPVQNFNDEPNDMIIAPNGNIYITGYSKTSPSSNDNNSNIFIFALDQDGNFLWADSIKGSGYTHSGGWHIGRHIGFSLALDAQGNIYVAGQSTGNDATEYDQGVVAKYNPAGQQQWLKFIDNSNAWTYTDYVRSMSIDASGNLYLCGATTLTTTWIDFAVWKYDSNGNFVWMTSHAGSDNNTSEGMLDIIADDAGNSYAFGISSDNKYVLMKYNTAGVQQWAYSFDTVSVGVSSSFTGADRHFAFDHDGNLIFHAPMSQRVGVAKFTPSGTMLWLTLVGGTSPNNNEGYDVQIDGANNIYIGGAISMVGNSYFDLGLMKLDASGNWLWTMAHNGPAGTNDKGHSVAVAGDGSLYVGGYSNGYSNSTDYFLIKYQDIPAGISTPAPVKKQLSVFPNPAGSAITVTADATLIGSSYSVYDNNGKQILSGLLNHAQTRIALDKLSGGVYYLKAGSHSQEPFTVIKQ